MTVPLEDLATHAKEQLGAQIQDTVIAYGELTFLVERDDIVDVLNFLKSDHQCQFISLIDISAVAREKRFDVVYHLLSPCQNLRVRVKVRTDDRAPVPSVVDVFLSADWFEREICDQYGVLFTGSPDPHRILADRGFEGHLLRKDFPLADFLEIRCGDELKRVVCDRVNLRLQLCNSDFLSLSESPDDGLPGKQVKQ